MKTGDEEILSELKKVELDINDAKHELDKMDKILRSVKTKSNFHRKIELKDKVINLIEKRNELNASLSKHDVGNIGDKDYEIIKELLLIGHNYRKFASSVLYHKKCTKKQSEALRKALSKAINRPTYQIIKTPIYAFTLGDA